MLDRDSFPSAPKGARSFLKGQGIVGERRKIGFCKNDGHGSSSQETPFGRSVMLLGSD